MFRMCSPKDIATLWWQRKHDWMLGKLTRGLYARLWCKKWSMWAKDRREIGRIIWFAYCTPNKLQIPQLNLEGPPIFSLFLPPFPRLLPHPKLPLDFQFLYACHSPPSAYTQGFILLDHSVLIHLLNFSPAFRFVLVCPFFQKAFLSSVAASSYVLPLCENFLNFTESPNKQ